MCQVNCTPSAGVPQEADLILTSKRDGTVFAATLVFHLHSSVKTRSPLKRVKVEKALYEMKAFEFTLANPFPADCEFMISLVHEKAEPAEAADEGGKGGAQKGGKRKNGKAAQVVHVRTTTCKQIEQIEHTQSASTCDSSFHIEYGMQCMYTGYVCQDRVPSLTS